MPENIKRYGGWSADAAAKDEERAASLAGNVFLDLQPGENVVRFIPPKPGNDSPFRVTAMHYVDAIPGLQKMLVFACPRAELKQPCPVCAEVERLNRTGNPIDKDRAYRISAGLRVYANVIDRNHPDVGPRILGFGVSIWNQLKSIRNSPRLGGDFTDPGPKGFDIVIVKDGEKMSTKYHVSAARDCGPLAATDAEIDEIIEASHDLEAQVNPVIPEELLRFWGEANLRSVGPAAQPTGRLPQGRGTVGAGLVGRASPAAVKPEDLDDDFEPRK